MMIRKMKNIPISIKGTNNTLPMKSTYEAPLSFVLLRFGEVRCTHAIDAWRKTKTAQMLRSFAINLP